ncbi:MULTISPECIES: nucleoside deaminase [Oceanospirillaceae]|uniref:nucleoside deaminase n=1 Tax=Oceanospirillaceae TaxID=135620 RepID=UPI0026E47A4C|nr:MULTISPECIES: nucleoside deaminase [unclassified Oceanobacter]MDO6680669.1 nucleoside deaminase [Oceanobacter sp. 5_MG-2023]MDP2506963.1 nucleoside deaminase [Oceanobacter sp. 3_MG-2023]MDP2547710.1 nucleoside deaminase [Oceanobacter sp. 4_MG-2023]|tara:strand:- start:10109 stop:10594 length:486 start_codon:yes stop_codon:yes gene_type:complete
MITDIDKTHLERTVVLAETALSKGNEPFGSVLVSETGEVLFEDHNHIGTGDDTLHPEFAVARWAASNMTESERATATVYTSGEHCPMCAAAHGLVGLGRIVYASSAEQYGKWLIEMGVPTPTVNPMPINAISPFIPVEGPVPELAERVRGLLQTLYTSRGL